MKRLVFLAHYFPPMGGAGVQRSVKFVKHLRSFGIDPVVFTGPAELHGRWQPEDSSLVSELPDDLELHRIPGSPPAQETRASRWFGATPPFATWLRTGMEQLAQTQSAPPDAVFVTLAPYEALAPALALAQRWGCPIVADLRDPWALDEVRIYPSGWHRWRERTRMRHLLAQCDAVLWNCPEACRAGQALLGERNAERQHCLTNGYDEADFAGLDARAPDGRLRIVHSGYLHTELGLRHRRRGQVQRMLGGELVPVDFLTRSHVFLLKALERLQQEDSALASKVELHLHGVLSETDTRLVEASAFRNIHLHGYTPHAEVVRALVESDVLFLPMHALPEGHRARIVPGKTYEYLRAGRRILAAVPPGDAQDFIDAAKAGRCVAPGDVSAIFEAIRDLAGPEAPEPLPEGRNITRFERRELTAQLAAIIDAIA